MSAVRSGCAGDGYIITIASIEALSPYPSAPAYSASKWGLRGWNKAVYAGVCRAVWLGGLLRTHDARRAVTRP